MTEDGQQKLYSILLVEDDPGDAHLVREMLAEATTAKFDLVYAERLATALDILKFRSFDVILQDLTLPDAKGLDIIETICTAAPQVPVVVMSGQGDEEMSIKAVQKGAQDYLVKGHVDARLLVRAIRYAIERKRLEEDLRIKALILDAATDSIFMHDLDGNFIYVNDTVCTTTGYTRAELLGMNLSQLNDNAYIPFIQPRIRELIEKGSCSFESAHIGKDGSRMPVELHARIIESEGRKLVLTVARDVRERKKAEEELQKSNQEISALYSVSAACSRSMNIKELFAEVLSVVTSLRIFNIEHKAGVFLIDQDTMELISQTGGSEEFIIRHKGMKVGECLCGIAAQTGQVILSRNSREDSRYTLRCPDANAHGNIIIPIKAKGRVLGVLYLYTTVDASLDERKTEMLIAMGDQIGISLENALLYKQTQELSLHDSLTGLANRRYMDILFEKAFASARRGNHLSVIMFDIDHFKMYNDTHGHAAGDRMLIRVARAASNASREMNVIARYGGEEFLVILPDAKLTEASVLAERIRKSVESEAGITVSLGVASFDQGITTKEELIVIADRALYKAKKNGRNRVEVSV